MGTSYYAITVVGARFNKDDLMVHRKERAFDHDHPENWKVCPETGRELWKEWDECIFGNSFELGYDKLGKLQTFRGYGWGDDQEVFIGRGVETSGSREGGGSAKLDIEEGDLDKIAKSIYKVLEKHGLNIDITNELGVWAVLSAC